MTKLEAEFAFEIGDLVYFKDACHGRGVRPRKFCIYERIAQQCHAETQRLYRLRGVPEMVAEVVLTRDEPPFLPATDAELAEHARWQRAERAAFRDEIEQSQRGETS